jgi:hypothetical protein
MRSMGAPIPRWRAQHAAPELLGVDGVEPRPLDAERLIVGDRREREGRSRRERAAPLGVGVTHQEIDAVRSREMAAEALPDGVGVGAEAPVRGLARLGEAETRERRRVVGSDVGGVERRHGGFGQG